MVATLQGIYMLIILYIKRLHYQSTWKNVHTFMATDSSVWYYQQKTSRVSSLHLLKSSSWN
jgi:hypothetical protein